MDHTFGVVAKKFLSNLRPQSFRSTICFELISVYGTSFLFFSFLHMGV